MKMQRNGFPYLSLMPCLRVSSIFKASASFGLVLSLSSLLSIPAWAQESQEMSASTPPSAESQPVGDTANAPVPPGPQSQSSENGGMEASNTGVAVNGGMQDSSINNNNNELTTGNNTNLNLIRPQVYVPAQSAGGMGGNAILMMPRNPLPLGNAALGRSNFGLQFGLQNNPILGGLGKLGGGQSALGWFLQAGLTIPFGKIPDVYRNNQQSPLDAARQQELDRRRNAFGHMVPNQGVPYNTKSKVQGRIVGMSAYNYATIPTDKIALPEGLGTGGGASLPRPMLFALESADVYRNPLADKDVLGRIEVGHEYPYLGHTRSGWIKVMLPNGKQGWTSTRFEYIKHDYTEIDTLALHPQAKTMEKTAAITLPLEKPSVKPAVKVKSSVR